MTDTLLQKGLPANEEVERTVLGCVLLNDKVLAQATAILDVDDFALEKHRRIYKAMQACAEDDQPIDYHTLATRLIHFGHLESIGGLAYLSELTEGMPRFDNIEAYCAIVKECSDKRHVIFTAQATMNAALEGDSTAAEIAETAIGYLAGMEASRTDLRQLGAFLRKYPGGPQVLLDATKWPKGIATGFSKLDEMTTGFHGGELVIIGARPSIGKTALALNMAKFAAQSGRSVALFSLEMSMDELVKRLLCSTARVCLHRFRGGFLNAEERRHLMGALHQATEWSLYVDDSGAATVPYIRSKCNRLRALGVGLDLVIVDYLQLMESKIKSENRNQQVSAMSRGLKLLAKDLGIPVVALSQLSRNPDRRSGKDNRPTLSDLRDSGSIEQDADVVLFIYREEVYKPDREDLHGLAEVMVAKQRNGPIGKVKLVFLHKFALFESRAEDLPEPETPVKWHEK